MRAWRFFNYAPKLAGDVKIKCVATISFDSLPFDAPAKLLRTGYKVNWNALLTRSNEDNHREVFIKAAQIDLLNVLEIDK